MKKLISLLLVLVLSVAMLSGICFAADPVECTEAEAVVKVTVDGDDTVRYYSELNQTLVRWVTSNLTTGMRYITFLKDIDSTGVKHGSGGFINLGVNTAEWGKKNYHKLTFDLGGFTWTYKGDTNLLYGGRYGCIVKNGTIVYENTAEGDHFVMADGSWKGAVRASAAFNPQWTLEGVTVIDTSATKNHAMLRTFNYETDHTIKDCNIYVENGDLMMFYKGTQEEAVTSKGEPLIYEGDYNSRLHISNSVIAVPNGAMVATAKGTPDTCSVEIADSLVVGAVKEAAANVTIKAEEPTVTEGYTVKVADKSATGTANVYGNAPSYKVELPFTDVKEGDWFFDFVAEMYGKKIINGMTETTFVPNGTLTYGQALKLIAVGLGEPEQPAGTHWASGYLLLAKENEWLTEDVDLNGPVTRLAFCQIAAKAKGLTEQPDSNPFKDTADTNVLALVKAGVISGMSADTFAPDQTLTRAQIAKIISLLIKL